MISLSVINVFSALLFLITPPDSISKNTLSHLTCINELNTSLPKDIKVFIIHIVAKKDNQVINYGHDDAILLSTLKPTGCTIDQEVRDFLAQVDLGRKIFIDFKYMRESEKIPRVATFGFFVTE